MSQREISNAANTATKLYREAIPKDHQSAFEICYTMIKAKVRLIKSIWSKKFKKYISIAHKDNGKEFFDEVHSLPTVQIDLLSPL